MHFVFTIYKAYLLLLWFFKFRNEYYWWIPNQFLKMKTITKESNHSFRSLLERNASDVRWKFKTGGGNISIRQNILLIPKTWRHFAMSRKFMVYFPIKTLVHIIVLQGTCFQIQFYWPQLIKLTFVIHLTSFFLLKISTTIFEMLF